MASYVYALTICIVVLILTCNNTNSFIAYDCMHSNANVSSVSLVDVTECPPSDNIPITSVDRSVQVIQEKEWLNIHVYHCKIDITKIISYCGIHSHTSIVDAGIQSYMVEVSQQECHTIHKTKSVSVERNLIYDIIPNSTLSTSITLAGSVDLNGNCKGVSYINSRNRYQNVIVTASIQISVKDYYTSVEIKSKSIIFNDGTKCVLDQTSCIHPVYGYTAWIESENSECSKYSRDVLYEGMAKVTSDDGSLKPGALISVNQGTSLFSLRVKSPSFSCYQKGFTTDHNRIVIIERPPYGFFFEKQSLDPRNIDLTMYMNSKISFVFGHIDNVVKDLYKELTTRDCELDRKTIKNKLMTARHHPLSLGNLINEDHGYISVVAGEVIYMTKCQIVNVQIRKSYQCYNNLPIVYNNQSLFMEPFSRIIVNTTMEVPCSPVTPPMYKVDGQWYTMNPSLQKASPPNIVGPTMKPDDLVYDNLDELLSSGIYSSDSMDRYREFMSFPLVRLEANSFLTAKLSHSNAYVTSSMSGIDVIGYDTIKSTGEQIYKDMIGWASNLGIFGGFMWIVLMCYKLLTKLCSTAINGITLYNIFGCGFFMIASVMTSCTHYLIMFKSKKSQSDNKDALGKELNAEILPLTSPPSTSKDGSLHVSSSVGSHTHSTSGAYPHINLDHPGF